MAENNELQTGIGTEEITTLKPAVVEILNIEFREVGEKKSKKLICSVKHPDSEEPIEISGVKYENKGKLEIAGLWKNLDSKGLIRKGSALAVFLQSQVCKNPEDLKGKKPNTIHDERGYLVFKAY